MDKKRKAGIVITPPFGYFKDKNTNRVEIAQLRQEIAENEEAIDELLLMKAMINMPSPR